MQLGLEPETHQSHQLKTYKRSELRRDGRLLLLKLFGQTEAGRRLSHNVAHVGIL